MCNAALLILLRRRSPEVVFPERPVPRLARHVEDGEIKIFLGEFFHFKPYSRRRLEHARLFCSGGGSGLGLKNVYLFPIFGAYRSPERVACF